jgi:bacteriorhodopsin
MLGGIATSEVVLQASAITGQEGWPWLLVGTILMGLGTLYFLVRAMGVEDDEAKLFFAVTTLVPAIAFASYMSMLLGYGVGEFPVGDEMRTIYWARYADWLFTTPLLLLDLGLLVDADRGTLLGLIGADGFMIVTGLVGATEEVVAFRYAWWAVSTAALLYILYVLYFGFTSRLDGMDEERAGTFRILRNLTVVLWAMYPIVWIVGTEGAAVVPLGVETLLYAVLDVTAKVGFGLLLLRSRSIFGDLDDAPEPSAGDAAASGD